MNNTKVLILVEGFMIGVMSIMAFGFSVHNKESKKADIPATELQKTNDSRYVTGLNAKNLTDREQAAEAIRNDHGALIKRLIRLAKEKVEPLTSSDPRFVEYPWHDSKHLSILLLGDLRAVEAVDILLENLTYKNPKSLESSEALSQGGWYPAAEALSKIGMPAVEPIIKKLGSYKPNSKGSDLCCWILKEILGVKLARLRLQIAIEDTREATIRENLTAVLPYFKTEQEKAAEERAQREKADQ
jgi:hypothetical protein